MNEYNPNRGPSWNYGGVNWKLSRSKIDRFIECPRCFYMDNKLGLRRPEGPSFQINKAVDHQLKMEFDYYRARGKQHPFQKEYGIDAKPVPHEMIDIWRDNFKGVQYLHKPTKLLVTGAIDDLWIDSKGKHIVVDYKATAKDKPITKIDQITMRIEYQRQFEVYQWLLRKNKLKVSDTAYWVYCTGIYDQKAFDKKIEFDVSLIPYDGDDSWVEPTIFEIKKCLESKKIPKPAADCPFCQYVEARRTMEK